MSDALPTVIVVHPKERKSKCTVEPLRGRLEFEFYRFPESVPLPDGGYVRLGLGGPELSMDDSACGLLVLDGTWRLAARMEPMFAHVPVRTLPPVQTAYPRKSQLFEDPDAGLATIEAVYAARRILGQSTQGLLDDYYWRDEFLRLNGWTESVESELTE